MVIKFSKNTRIVLRDRRTTNDTILASSGFDLSRSHFPVDSDSLRSVTVTTMGPGVRTGSLVSRKSHTTGHTEFCIYFHPMSVCHTDTSQPHLPSNKGCKKEETGAQSGLVSKSQDRTDRTENQREGLSRIVERSWTHRR